MHFGRVGMLSRPCGVSVFDDYALPANYGEPEPPAKQKAPERPRMRVVPNADEMPTPTHVEAYGSLGVPRMSGYGAAAAVTLPLVKGRAILDHVKALQSVLLSKGYYLGTTGDGRGIDGDWGDLTTAAVEGEQAKYGLTVNGDYVDAALWAKMTAVAQPSAASAPKQTTTAGGVQVATSGVLGLLQGLTGQTQPGTTFQPSTASDAAAASGDKDTTESGTNWMPWVAAGVGVLVIGGIIYAVTRKSDKDEE